MPVRIQQRRTKGWRKPENTVSVARPGQWGNPFVAGTTKWLSDPEGNAVLVPVPDIQAAVDLFRWYVTGGEREALIRSNLRGKNLMCFCPLDQPCHADVLLELANPAPLCPECRDGKCRNCVGKALTDDDELVPCGCPNHREVSA